MHVLLRSFGAMRLLSLAASGFTACRPCGLRAGFLPIRLDSLRAACLCFRGPGAVMVLTMTVHLYRGSCVSWRLPQTRLFDRWFGGLCLGCVGLQPDVNFDECALLHGRLRIHDSL